MFTKENKNTFAVKPFVVLLTLLLLVSGSQAPAQEQQGARADTDLTQMSLEELMNVEVVSSASLTKTTQRNIPAAITTITQEDIRASGARNLKELLDIYVPNFQYIRFQWEPDLLGMRGVLTTQKMIMLVNGRIINNRVHIGAISELDLVMLSDIHHIDVVRGPGSAIYGPGALSGVISIVTDNAGTFEGSEVTTKVGAIEEFYSAEFKNGHKFEDGDGGLFLYGGISRYVGADQDYAPEIYGTDFATSSFGTQEHAGVPVSYPINRDGAAYRDLPQLKFHAQLTKGDWDIWSRYVRGGQYFTWPLPAVASNSSGVGWADWTNNYQMSFGYQQATGYIGFHPDITENLKGDFALSYDMFDYERTEPWAEGFAHANREDEYYAKALLRWDISDRHKLAFGSEFSHEEFGLKSPGYPGEPAYDEQIVDIDGNPIIPMPRWSTDMYSLLGEYQWGITDQLTTLVGARLDKHTYTYTDKMFSPRAAVVLTPNEKDTYKVMVARSVRMLDVETMYVHYQNTGEKCVPEVLDSGEIRYERQQSKNLNLAASLFYIDLDLDLSSGEGKGGTEKQWGFELEASYHTDRTRFVLSHGYTKLVGFAGFDPTYGPWSTAEPYGYGHDLAFWSNHITKLTGHYQINDQLAIDGSLRIYWGFPGTKDWVDYQSDSWVAGDPLNNKPYTEPGWERAYRESIFLNLGFEYKPQKNLIVRVDGYNLLGIFDEDLNKRIYFQSHGGYRCQAPAVGVSLTYKF